VGAKKRIAIKIVFSMNLQLCVMDEALVVADWNG
jgi:energy-coupling factor transporter ATP-binding protein EcfA2